MYLFTNYCTSDMSKIFNFQSIFQTMASTVRCSSGFGVSRDHFTGLCISLPASHIFPSNWATPMTQDHC